MYGGAAELLGKLDGCRERRDGSRFETLILGRGIKDEASLFFFKKVSFLCMQ